MSKSKARVHEISTFQEWKPKEYLEDYYSEVEQDEKFTLDFLIKEFRRIKNKPIALEFGTGPTIHHLLPLSPYVSEIHVCDFLQENLDEIKKWQVKSSDMHDWRKFTEKVLDYEGGSGGGFIEKREGMTRNKITRYLLGDAMKSNPLGKDFKGYYELLLSCYCVDSITVSKKEWRKYMSNIVSLLSPGGLFVTAALGDCKHYRVGERYFPCANITGSDMRSLFLDLDFDMSTVHILIVHVPEHKDVGYENIVLASGYRKVV